MDFGFWILDSDFACNLQKVDFGFSACDWCFGQMDLKMDRILVLVKKKGFVEENLQYRESRLILTSSPVV